jgi:hypothetical protein
MKKIPVFFLMALGLGCSASFAHAAYHSFEGAAGLAPTEVVDKSQLEGWIVKVDYRGNSFRLLDPRGFERTVKTLPGAIGSYRLGDHVKVSIDPDYRVAPLIEKV